MGKDKAPGMLMPLLVCSEPAQRADKSKQARNDPEGSVRQAGVKTQQHNADRGEETTSEQ